MSVLHKTLKKPMKSFKNQYGQGLMEYVLILVLVSIASVVIMGLLGTDISGLFTSVEGKL